MSETVRFALITLGIVALVALDTYLYVYRGPDATLSQQAHDWTARYPIVAFVLGLIVGHALWPLR